MHLQSETKLIDTVPEKKTVAYTREFSNLHNSYSSAPFSMLLPGNSVNEARFNIENEMEGDSLSTKLFFFFILWYNAFVLLKCINNFVLDCRFYLQKEYQLIFYPQSRTNQVDTAAAYL